MSWNKKSLSNDRRKPAYNRGTQKRDTASILQDHKVEQYFSHNAWWCHENYCYHCEYGDRGPSVRELRIGKFVLLLEKLQLRGAKQFLDAFYW